MTDATRKFATGVMLLWYPIKDEAGVAAFRAAATETGVHRLLAVEQWVRTPGGDGLLAGAGMLLVNPPYTLTGELDAILPELTDLLAVGAGAGWRLDTLVGEGRS